MGKEVAMGRRNAGANGERGEKNEGNIRERESGGRGGVRVREVRKGKYEVERGDRVEGEGGISGRREDMDGRRLGSKGRLE